MLNKISNVTTERLIQCESVIERGLHTFIDVGNALLEIRDNRLYREQYSTFEDYCRERWNIQRAHAYRMIEAAKLNTILSPIGDILPITESQARPLTSLEPEEQITVWQRVVETAPAKGITASHVQDVVDRYIRPENIHVSDDSYEWYTPAEYIESARLVMGGIDLDPASNTEAQEIVKAGEYFTKTDNGLELSWYGRVWLNPPYCMPEIEQFTSRVIDGYVNGRIDQAIVLTNNGTDTNWFHDLLSSSGIACLTKGRVKFWGPNASGGGPRQGQTIFYFGKDKEAFANEFRKYGIIVRTE